MCEFSDKPPEKVDAAREIAATPQLALDSKWRLGNIFLYLTLILSLRCDKLAEYPPKCEVWCAFGTLFSILVFIWFSIGSIL